MRSDLQRAQDENTALESLVAADVMIPFPRTCSPFSTVTEAVLIFKDEDANMVPVVDSGKPVGIVVDRDIALAVASEPMLAQQPVFRIMNHDILTAPAETPVDRVSRMMAVTNAHMLLVVDPDGLLLGTIS